MMRKMLVTAAAIALLAGCGPLVSVQPMYTEEDAVYEAGLTGAWEPAEDNGLWFIYGDSKSRYRVVTISPDAGKVADEVERYEMRLVRLGGALFADLQQTGKPDDGLSVRGHIFARLRLEGDQLGVALLGSEWLGQRIGEWKFPNRKDRGEVVLTGSTEQLRALVGRVAEDPRAFGDETLARRLR